MHGRNKRGKFTEGNTFGKGRPARYKPYELAQGCQEYFIWVDANPWYKTDVVKSGEQAGQILKIPVQRPLTLSGLCTYLGITSKTWYDYSIMDRYLDICSFVREIIDGQQLEGAMVGVFNPSITARRLGLVDVKEHQGNKDKPIEQNITSVVRFEDYTTDNGIDS